MIDDGYGDQLDPELVLPDYHRWLYRVAYSMLPVGSDKLEDLVQEGRVAIWKALATHDRSKGALAPWVTKAAEMRMRDVAWGKGQPLGRPETRGSREVDLGPSLDAIENESYREALLGVVEEAYQDGEIERALDDLTPEQRQYVFLRFWGGLDPNSQSPATKALILQFPVLRDRKLWREAKLVLAEKLQHLAS